MCVHNVFDTINRCNAVSSSFSKYACGCFRDSTTLGQTIYVDKQDCSTRPRRNTASTISSDINDKDDEHKDDLEGENPIVNDKMSHHRKTAKYEFSSSSAAAVFEKNKNKKNSTISKRREEIMRYAQLPSGLSVESPDSHSELESSEEGNGLLLPHLPVPVLSKTV